MSGLYLPGMEMPTRCGECPLSLYPHSPCWKNGGALDWENRPDWCPLIELPAEHGDLIDRDELRKKKWAITWDEGKAECKAEYYNAEDIEAAPAVIPAEEGET